MIKEKIDKGIRISPKYYQRDWHVLSLENIDSPDWNTAIKIFKDRMEGRLLKQIELLDKNPNRKIGVFAGFAIMSLECLFIETLEQFYKGEIETGQGMSKKAFFIFFQRSPIFRRVFDTQDKAAIFYRHIRCGLLHQAQTKKKSTIHIHPNEEMLQWVNPQKIEEGLKIQRKLFHNEVVNIYNSYVEKLRDKRNLDMIRKFKRKMDYIVNQE
jgi:hypothetical protein